MPHHSEPLAPLWPVRLQVPLHYQGRHGGTAASIVETATALITGELAQRLRASAQTRPLLRVETADVDAMHQNASGSPVTITATAHLTLLVGADTYAGACQMAIPVLRLRLFRAACFTVDYAGVHLIHSPETAACADEPS